MKTIGTRAALVLLILAAGLSAAFAQGMYWESKVTSDKMEKSDVTKTWYMPKMLKIQMSDGGDYSILRLDQEKMILVKPDDKTYSVVTFAQMEERMKKGNAQMEKALEQMKDLPREQREMMEKMLGKSKDKQKDKVSLKRSAETKKVNGYTCVRNTIYQGTEKLADLWVTKEIRGFEAMRNDLKSFSSRMAAMNPMMGKDLAEAMMNVDGFPMEQSVAGITSVTTKVEYKMTPPSEFDVPAGFKKVEMKGMGEGQE